MFGGRLRLVHLVMGTIAIVGTLVITACGQSSSSAASKKLVVGLASEGLEAPFPAAIAQGAQSIASKYGIKLITLDGKLTESTQEADVRTLIADHVNGIIIDVIDPGPTTSLIKEANAAHIPVMLVHGYAGSTANPVYPGVAFEVDENEIHAGVEAGQLALKADPSGGEVAIVTGTPGYVAVTQREDGFLSVIKPTGKYTVVATLPGDWTPTGGYNACSSVLQSHPHVTLFYTESDDMALGCLKAVQADHSNAKIVSIGGESAIKSDIANGTVYGTICYEPYTEGQIVMKAMYNLLTGMAHYNRTLDFYSTPPVTASNINDCGWQW